MTSATFTVNGKNKREIESRAIEIIADLFGPDAGGVVFDMQVVPLVEQLGTDKPMLWEAEVTARAKA